MHIESIPVVLPLDICDSCKKINLIIGSKQLFYNDTPMLVNLYAGCEHEEFCTYIHEKLKKEEEQK